MKCKFTIIFLLIILSVNVYSQNWDINTLHQINQIESTKGYSTFISNTTSVVDIGTPLALGAVSLLTHDDEMLKNSIYIGAVTVINASATYGLKKLFNRPRPVETYPDLIDAYSHTSDRSFPSGHTSSAFALATSLTIVYPKWYIVAPSYFWAASVGYSRMNLGMHYPTDVIAGAVLGAGSAYATNLVNDWFWKKQNNKKILAELGYWEVVE